MIATQQLAEHSSPWAMKAQLLTRLIEMRAAKHNINLPSHWKSILNYDDAATAGFDAINFLYSEHDRTINPYPVLQIGSHRLYGPADNFNTILCGEMENCEIWFYKFQEETESDYLAQIAAVLWRPKDFWRKKVVPFSEIRAERMLPVLKKLPVEKLLAIYIWYSGCRNQLPKYFPYVYFKGGTESGEPKDDLAFTKCIHAGAGPKNGTRPEVRLTPAKEFLFEMDLQAKEVEEIKKQRNSS